MVDRIGLDCICVFGMAPVEYVELAAKLGCTDIGMSAKPVVGLPEFYPQWTLRDNPALVRDVKAAVAHHGIGIAVAEGFFVLPNGDVSAFAADLDLLADVGAKRATICVFETDRTRAFDQLGAFAELAAARGMGSQVEFVPSLAIGDFATALDAINYIGRKDFGMVVDSMHLFRCGATAADVATLAPEAIGHIQICDVPWKVAPEGHGMEAGSERLCPGEGELPLAELIAVLPEGRVIGLEVPMKKRTLAGESAESRLRPCVEATRALLAEARSAATAG
ncbi:MAG TPA: sugar phosphate isomerase/epimerase [Sphingobium sp.]|uniref:sugar phosphate isomerase/epimerase family protein n=1 Tax=Sphingobium sp. TaxID=1912891 RepID=UPI002ED26A80